MKNKKIIYTFKNIYYWKKYFEQDKNDVVSAFYGASGYTTLSASLTGGQHKKVKRGKSHFEARGLGRFSLCWSKASLHGNWSHLNLKTKLDRIAFIGEKNEKSIFMYSIAPFQSIFLMSFSGGQMIGLIFYHFI